VQGRNSKTDDPKLHELWFALAASKIMDGTRRWRWLSIFRKSKPRMTRYIIKTRVARLERVTNKVYVNGVGAEAVFREEPVGWFVHLTGSRESLLIDVDRQPELKVGDEVKITIEKVK
jgi:hypothetical protein